MSRNLCTRRHIPGGYDAGGGAGRRRIRSGETCQGSVSKEWTVEEEEELNDLLAEILAEVAGGLVKRALDMSGGRRT